MNIENPTDSFLSAAQNCWDAVELSGLFDSHKNLVCCREQQKTSISFPSPNIGVNCRKVSRQVVTCLLMDSRSAQEKCSVECIWEGLRRGWYFLNIQNPRKCLLSLTTNHKLSSSHSISHMTWYVKYSYMDSPTCGLRMAIVPHPWPHDTFCR